MRTTSIRTAWLAVVTAALLAPLSACKSDGDDSDTDTLDCDAIDTVPLGTVAVSEWPAGMAEAQQAYQDLDGSWTADACGTRIGVQFTTIPDVANIQLVQDGLPPGHSCGCTSDPDNPDDGLLNVIAYTTINISVSDYPEPEFREENAGNVPSVPVALFDGADGIRVRACTNHLVPPILMSDWTDTLIAITNSDSGPAGVVQIVGDDVQPKVCDLTDWTAVGSGL
jgi:hypothetical protein